VFGMTAGTLVFQVLVPTLSLATLIWILIEVRAYAAIAADARRTTKDPRPAPECKSGGFVGERAVSGSRGQ